MKLEMKQRMEQTDYKKLADEFRLRLRNIRLDAEFMEIPLPRVRELAAAIDALLAERDAHHSERERDLSNFAKTIDALRAKLGKATEALMSIPCSRTPFCDDIAHHITCSYWIARKALAAIKETTNAKP